MLWQLRGGRGGEGGGGWCARAECNALSHMRRARCAAHSTRQGSRTCSCKHLAQFAQKEGGGATEPSACAPAVGRASGLGSLAHTFPAVVRADLHPPRLAVGQALHRVLKAGGGGGLRRQGGGVGWV